MGESEDAPGRVDREATVLVVDDDRDVADLYATWLDDQYEVHTAYGGEEALARIDDRVDVVLLDRQMPGSNGDDVAEALECRTVDPWVVLVTAIDPDLDVLRLPIDDYLVKPVRADDLTGAVARMLERARYNDTLREYFALATKKATLEATAPRSELEHDEGYRDVAERVTELRNEADAAVRSFEGAYEPLFGEFGDEL